MVRLKVEDPYFLIPKKYSDSKKFIIIEFTENIKKTLGNFFQKNFLDFMKIQKEKHA